MTIHREGYQTITISALAFAVINLLSFYFISAHVPWLSYIIFIVTLALLLFLISFFRVPNRKLTKGEDLIICPADGKVVVIEEIVDEEYFKDRRLQISIFMSPANVHQNRNPVGGEVVYNQYHKGKYLVAWHPKSSTENERTTIVTKMKNGNEILFRQIAGALARRIKWYVKEGQPVQQGEEFGFIKFGSRVDIFLPLNAKINVGIGDITKGGRTVIAELA